jgi:lipopolysaccharide biosynthesis glycosyltransferase
MKIVSCIDDAFSPHYGAMVESVRRANPGVDIHYFLLHAGLQAENQRKLLDYARRHALRMELLDANDRRHQLAGLLVSQHVSLATYYRLLIPALLPPSASKVLYLDVDLIVRAPLSDLYDIDISEYGAAAVHEPDGILYFEALSLPSQFHYFNAGVLLINLDYWRSRRIAETALEFAQFHPELLRCWDQCALNYALRGQVLFLGYEWNYQPPWRGVKESTTSASCDRSSINPKIVHYAGFFKPWHFMSDQEYKEEYWAHLANTPWSDYRPPDRTMTNRLKKLVPIKWRNYLRPIRSRVFGW